jgi:hypothetical protein
VGAAAGSPVKICVIAGVGRSGSSILSKILGQYDGFFDAGELIKWWEATTSPGWRCGCGAELPDCPVWSVVLGAVARETDPQTADELATAQSILRLRTLLPLTWHHLRGQSDHLDSSRQILASIYRSIISTSQARVIIDTSKVPLWVDVVDSVDGADVRVVHLVRDPRATAFSLSRVRGSSSGIAGRQMPRMGSFRSALYWAGNHGAMMTSVRRSVGRRRYLRVHHEDLVASPRRVTGEILTFLQESDTDGPFLDDRTVSLGVTHNLGGNVIRFDHGPVRITADDQWIEDMPRAARLITLAIAGPMMPLLRHGSRRS